MPKKESELFSSTESEIIHKVAESLIGSPMPVQTIRVGKGISQSGATIQEKDDWKGALCLIYHNAQKSRLVDDGARHCRVSLYHQNARSSPYPHPYLHQHHISLHLSIGSAPPHPPSPSPTLLSPHYMIPPKLLNSQKCTSRKWRESDESQESYHILPPSTTLRPRIICSPVSLIRRFSMTHLPPSSI